MSAGTGRVRRLGPPLTMTGVKTRDGTDQTDVRPNGSAFVEAALRHEAPYDPGGCETLAPPAGCCRRRVAEDPS
jgi:hypothetical protein